MKKSPNVESSSQVRVNWVDERRGTTTFLMTLGEHITQSEYQQHCKDGQLFVSVFYSDPGSPYVDKTYPSPCCISKEQYERDVALLYSEFQKTFASDIVCHGISKKGEGLHFSWPDSDKLCWAASQPAR